MINKILSFKHHIWNCSVYNQLVQFTHPKSSLVHSIAYLVTLLGKTVIFNLFSRNNAMAKSSFEATTGGLNMLPFHQFCPRETLESNQGMCGETVTCRKPVANGTARHRCQFLTKNVSTKSPKFPHSIEHALNSSLIIAC